MTANLPLHALPRRAASLASAPSVAPTSRPPPTKPAAAANPPRAAQPAAVDLAKSGPDSSLTAAKPSQAQRAGGRLSKRELLLVVTQLSIMVRAGVDLAEAVRNIANRSSSAPIRAAMGGVYASLEDGCGMSQALSEQREKFGGLMVASVAAGEASGRLPEVLGRLSNIIRDELRLQSSLRSVISYPLVLTLVTLLVLAAMVFFVLPQFAGIYEASRAPIPAVTQLLLQGAKLARSYWWLLLGLGGGGALAAIQFARSAAGRRQIDRLCFRLPMIKVICRSLFAGRMFRLQGAMLESGVPMLEVLQLTRPAVGNACFEELIDQIRAAVTNGESVASVLGDSPFIPEGAAEMVVSAEGNGQLGGVLQTIGEFYESEGEQHLRDAVKIAEPAIIVGLGLVVGVIVLAVMLPLLDLSTAGGM